MVEQTFKEMSNTDNLLLEIDVDADTDNWYRNVIIRKSLKYDELSDLHNKLITAKTDEKKELNRLWNDTDWSTIIEGRATDKTKKAYVDAEIRIFKEKVEKIENQINELWRDIDLLNDFLKFGGIDD